MLGVIICDESSVFKKLAMQELKNLIAYNDLKAEIVLVTGNPEEIAGKFDGSRTYFLMLDLVYGNAAIGTDIARKIRGIDRESYIVFATEHTELMNLIFKGMIKPAGFIKKPATDGDISIVFMDAYSDYLNISEGIDKFTVSVGARLYKIPYKRIFYFEASEKKIMLYTENQRISFYDSLEAIGRRMADKGFLRCHKGFVVNREKVESIDFSDMLIYMSNGATLPFSRTYKDVIRNEFGNEA